MSDKQSAALVARLRAHERGMRDQCLCRSDQENCMRCDCGVAADEIERLCAVIIHYADQCGIPPEEAHRVCKL